MDIRIKPLDTLFFRDGKPFTMGEDAQGESLFPPAPSVLYGALRTAYFGIHSDMLDKANGQGDPTADLKVGGAWLIRDGSACFPIPLDLAADASKPAGKDGDRPVWPLPAVPPPPGSSLHPLPSLLSGGLESESVPRGVLEAGQLASYLSGGGGPFIARSLSENVLREPKIGIAKDKATGTAAQDGRLYQAHMLRLKDLELGASFNGLDLPSEGMLKLGGEGRPVSYRAAARPDMPAPAGEAKSFRLYLSTPALFANGWLPGWLDPATLTGMAGGLKLELTAAAVGRPAHVGGFDVKEGKPKPMRRAVPEGSVYHFRIAEGTLAGAVAAFHGRSVSELPGSAAQGFGLAYVGAIK